MQSLASAAALILISSTYALEIQDAINYAANAKVDAPIPQVNGTAFDGSYTNTFKGKESVTINGQKYTVNYDSYLGANGRLNFTSFNNMNLDKVEASAEGAVMSTGKFAIDSFGTVGYYLAMDGRVKYVNNILKAEGAIAASGDMGDEKVKIDANGFLTCDRITLTCSRVEGSYDVSILTQWLKYAGKGNLNGVAGVVNGNVVFTGSQTNQQTGSYMWDGSKVIWVSRGPKTAEKADNTVPTTTKSNSATTTAKPTPTQAPDSSATSVGTSMLAVVASIAAFFF